MNVEASPQVDTNCPLAANPLPECMFLVTPGRLKNKKSPRNRRLPGADVLTLLMEYLGALMFFIGFACLQFSLICSIGSWLNESFSFRFSGLAFCEGPTFFFMALAVMLGGAGMYLLGSISHRLWSA